MTTTDLTGLPAEIAAVLARAGLAQDAACERAGIPRTSYYRRKSQPGAWQIEELSEFLATAGTRLEIGLAGQVLNLSTRGILAFRLGELLTVANAMDSGLTIGLEPSVTITTGAGPASG